MFMLLVLGNVVEPSDGDAVVHRRWLQRSSAGGEETLLFPSGQTLHVLLPACKLPWQGTRHSCSSSCWNQSADSFIWTNWLRLWCFSKSYLNVWLNVQSKILTVVFWLWSTSHYISQIIPPTALNLTTWPTISGPAMYHVTIVMKCMHCFFWLLMSSFNISSYVRACWTGQRYADRKAEQLAGPVQWCLQHARDRLVHDWGTAYASLHYTAAFSFSLTTQHGRMGGKRVQRKTSTHAAALLHSIFSILSTQYSRTS